MTTSRSALVLSLFAVVACNSGLVTDDDANAPNGGSGSSPSAPWASSDGGGGESIFGEPAPLVFSDACATRVPLLDAAQAGPGEMADRFVGATATDAVFRTSSGVTAVPLDASAPPVTIYGSELTDAQVKTSGGAVAIWDDAGTLHVWTRASGLVTVGPASDIEHFVASADGTRIAFAESVGASIAVRVRRLEGASQAASLAFNGAADKCRPMMAFVNGTFLALFCPGTAPDATNAELVTVSEAGAVARLDAAGSAAPTLAPAVEPDMYFHSFRFKKSLFDRDSTDENVASAMFGYVWEQPLFAPDASGTKVLALRADGSGVVLATNAAPVVFDASVVDGMMLPDGSAVIYRTAENELKRATTTSPPVVTTLATDVLAIDGRSADGARVFFSRKIGEYGVRDLHSVDHAAATPHFVTHVSKAELSWGGVNGTGTHLVVGTNDRAATIELATASVRMLPAYSTFQVFPEASSGTVIPPTCPMGCASSTYVDVTTGEMCALGSAVDAWALRKDRMVVVDTSDQAAFATTLR